MNCKVCGNGSGKYPLCQACNLKKERGEIVKCAHCNNWHYANVPCLAVTPTANNHAFLYNPKSSLLSKSERAYYIALCAAVPHGYCVLPQSNLAAFLYRTDDARFHNELFRNVDFLITSAQFQPLMVVEINDQTHYNHERKERDEKVRHICEEAGIPVLTLWTSYGVNSEYIQKRVEETLSSLPVARIHHFNKSEPPSVPTTPPPTTPFYYPATQPVKSKHGCYVATAVYGSYDCPPVWTLRRYRDQHLAATWYGRAFIRIYYAISPTLVQWFGKDKWFHLMCKKLLDRKVTKLQSDGFESTPYNDQKW